MKHSRSTNKFTQGNFTDANKKALELIRSSALNAIKGNLTDYTEDNPLEIKLGEKEMVSVECLVNNEDKCGGVLLNGHLLQRDEDKV